MHMADALVTPIVAGSMYACSGAAMVYSIKKSKSSTYGSYGSIRICSPDD